MNDVKQFTQVILKEKQDALQKQFEENQKDLLAQTNRLKQDIDAKFEQKRQQMVQEVALQQTIAKQQLENQKRNAVLAHRQEHIDVLFEKAVDKIADLPMATVDQLVHAALAKLDNSKQYVITFGEKTHYTGELPAHVTLSTDTIAEHAGFVIDSDGVRLNYLASQLVAHVKRDYVSYVNQLLQ